MATGRVNIRSEPCPVLGCSYHNTRLDRHLGHGHPELDSDMVALKLGELKREMTVRSLVALRATEPLCPMATGLDIHLKVETDHQPEETEEASCLLPQCIQTTEKLERSEHKLMVVEKELQRTVKLLQRVTKRERRVSKKNMVGAGKADAGPSREVEGSEDEEAGPSHENRGALARRQAVRAFLKQQQGRSSTSATLVLPREIDQYLERYMTLHGSTRGNAKKIANAKSKLSRIRTFILFLACGEKRLWDWCFMDNVDGIMNYAEYLGEVGMTVTTANYYLQNIFHFVKYLSEAPPRSSRLTVGQRTTVVRAVKTSIEHLNKTMVIHQMKVKASKMSNIISKASLHKCQMKAKVAIPLLLDQLEAEGCNPSLRDSFYGHISAFLASVYGHRPGVLTNMTVEEVLEAAGNKTKTDEGFVISISEHKTNRKFGAAVLFLHPEEFSWLARWIELRKGLKPQNNRMLTTSRGPVKQLGLLMQVAWAQMGLPGKPTFNDIRTALSAHAHQTHGPSTRKMITNFMCHNTDTADRFYALSLNCQRAANLRKDFEAAVEMSPSS